MFRTSEHATLDRNYWCDVQLYYSVEGRRNPSIRSVKSARPVEEGRSWSLMIVPQEHRLRVGPKSKGRTGRRSPQS